MARKQVKQSKKEEKPTKQRKRAGGRPKKIPDWDKVELMASLKLPAHNIAFMLNFNKDVLLNKIHEKYGTKTYKEFQDLVSGRIKLNLTQKALAMALSGNTTMMIFCLKNICHWQDKMEVAHTSREPIKLAYKLD